MLRIWKICVRFYSVKHVTQKPIKYTGTINLPNTKFPNRLTLAKRLEIEQELLEDTFSKAYGYQEANNKEPTFVLHDGPPYANGDLHMGHAVNKILKDITLRHHVMNGQKVQYIPGWDCHGLPIELRATAAAAAAASVTATICEEDALKIRNKSRQFALAAIQNQRAEFRSWGIFSDWHDKNIYLTFNPKFIMNQLQMFFNFFDSGLVYRALKPVYWSPSSRTALAEAELEYDANFVSPSVYLRFKLTKFPTVIATECPNDKVFALVWTTTPWTLASNQAICYNEALEYSLVKLHGTAAIDNDLYLIASNLINDFESTTQLGCEIVKRIAGTELSTCCYQHPIYTADQTLPFYVGAHVQDTKGTGLVHTAPAHGPDDFLVSLEHKLPVKSFVDASGIYTQDAPPFLRGKAVLEEGDRLVLEHISQNIVYANRFTHAYPIDWRTKKPVIIRASEQWFMNTDQLKDRALKEIDNIAIYPRVNAEASRKLLITQVQKRPYWCISRQRAWGVPIPVFYNKHTGAVVINKAIIDHICDMIQNEGSVDFWWSKSVGEILPKQLLNDLELSAEDLVKGSDIFDIWFDSGSTWSSVLQGEKVADVYLEGYDQFNGWFQSSLLTSVATRNRAPFKSLFVHGFTVDEKGHKMSKSVGNVISPQDITKKYGTDVLRWWVAAHATQHMSIVVSDKLLQQTTENVRKLRANLRYLNGVIGVKCEQVSLIPMEQQTYLNKYLLSCLVKFEDEVQKCYNCYEYNRAVASIQNFMANQLSAIYVHLIKDRLYCGNDTDIKMVRFTLTHCYKVLCKALWPIVPFLVEESWNYYDTSSSFHEQRVKTNREWKNDHVEDVVNTAMEVKRLINQHDASDSNSWTLDVTVLCSAHSKLKLLQKLHPILNTPTANSELCEILQVGSVSLSKGSLNSASTDEIAIIIKNSDAALCPRCRRYSLEHDDTTCIRCTEVLRKF